MKHILILLLIIPCSIEAQDSLVVRFNFNSDRLSQQESQKLTKALNQMSTIERIIGYTDSIGVEIYNLDLSQRRAKSVAALLDSIRPELVRNTLTEGRGELPSRNSLNRKVVIYYQKTLKSKLKSAKIGDKITMNNLNFEPGLDVLLAESIPQLAELLKIMNENAKLKISIQGHICCSPTDDLDLSTNRAKVVYDYLINNGIDADRLNYRGFGSTSPIYALPEKDEMERIANRRVELRIVAKNK